MQTLFPVQYSRADDESSNKAVHQVIQGALIHHVIECSLLEKWLDDSLITVTTTTDYLAQLSVEQGSQQDFQQGLQKELAGVPSADHMIFAKQAPLLVMQIGIDSRLLLLVERGYTSPWRLQRSYLPVLHRVSGAANSNATSKQATSKQAWQPIATVQHLLDILLSAMDCAALSTAGISKLQQSLDAALIAQKRSASADITTTVYGHPHWYQTLIVAEQWASLMDRPFHPLAKGKLGFSAAEYQRYLAEFNQSMTLVWVAVDKTHLMVADKVITNDVTDHCQPTPAVYLLDKVQQQRLAQELADKHLADSHVAIPVHPWQMTQIITEIYADDMTDGTVVKLAFDELETYASASMRSMLIGTDSPYSIKLPIGVYALNSKRYLPALKLINGEKNQAILQQARQADILLSTQLRLWDERLWWGYMPPHHVQDKSATNPSFYQEKPTHLGAMLRRLPADLCCDDVRLLPMASLGMVVYKDGISHHIFDEIIQSKRSSKALAEESKQLAGESEHRQAAAIDCFTNLCDIFLGTMLRCLRLGLAPEMHGQNIVMVVQDHRFMSVLLRDHDSVRIYLPWLARHHIADPEYLSPPEVKNRLYRETPQALIFYLQSLGLLVNIRAIIESLSEHYHISEPRLWRVAADCIESSLVSIDFDADQRDLLNEQLLTTPYYPHKTLLLPVIERGIYPHGSMPAGESITTNPFFVVAQSEQNV